MAAHSRQHLPGVSAARRDHVVHFDHDNLSRKCPDESNTLRCLSDIVAAHSLHCSFSPDQLRQQVPPRAVLGQEALRCESRRIPIGDLRGSPNPRSRPVDHFFLREPPALSPKSPGRHTTTSPRSERCGAASPEAGSRSQSPGAGSRKPAAEKLGLEASRALFSPSTETAFTEAATVLVSAQNFEACARGRPSKASSAGRSPPVKVFLNPR